jgi:hypothetical protein
MSDVDEPTYTLTEAQRELSRRQCAAVGHSWTIISTYDGWPARITCDNCGWSGAVTMLPDTPTP